MLFPRNVSLTAKIAAVAADVFKNIRRVIEIRALENAGRQRASVYRDVALYTTLSPCAMCSGAILLYGIPQVVVGENRTFLGEETLLRARGVQVEVLQEPACVELMREFIASNPALWNEDIGLT